MMVMACPPNYNDGDSEDEWLHLSRAGLGRASGGTDMSLIIKVKRDEAVELRVRL